MALNDELLEILQGPTTRQNLSPLGEASLALLNAKIEAGQIKTLGGREITGAAAAALVTQDRTKIFLVAPFPKLLPEDAIDPTLAGIKV
jgi:uncharacterized protein YbaR (Trm112 family)